MNRICERRRSLCREGHSPVATISFFCAVTTKSLSFVLGFLAVLAGFTPASFGQEARLEMIQFDRDVLPIFAEHCFPCHGPDQATRQSEFAFHELESWIENAAEQVTLINPGRPKMSSVVQRITTHDVDLKMPPPNLGRGPSPQDVEILIRWIAEGAVLTPHWASTEIRRPDIPVPKQSSWIQNPIDAFVLEKLEANGRQPNRRAPAYVLRRRLHLALTGLPPAVEGVQANLNARMTRHQTQRLIDRLLASPAYGERMAQAWLDAARYADTTGHAADRPRTMWMYRNWVIDALNAGQPFNEFSTEQLAGDMLPDASVQQRIATGFHRNSIQALGNNPRKEEYRIKGIVDRVETTGRVWLGLTVGCAECHDHKYDALTQRDYYELFAIFNNVPHLGEKFDVHGPRIDVLPPSIEREVAALERQLSTRQYNQANLQRLTDEERLQQLLKAYADPLSQAQQQAAILVLDATEGTIRFGERLQRRQDLSINSEPRTGVKLPSSERSESHGPWPHSKSLSSSSMPWRLSLEQFPGLRSNFSIGAWIRTTSGQADLVSQYDWRSGQRSYVFGLGGQGEPASRDGHLFAWVSEAADPFRGMTIDGSIPVNDGQWHHVAVQFSAGESIQLYVDGQLDSDAKVSGEAPASVAAATLPLVVGGGYSGDEKPAAFLFEGDLADLRIVPRSLTGEQLGGVPSETRMQLANVMRGEQYRGSSSTVARLLKAIRLSAASSPSSLEARIAALKELTVQAQVMDELAEPRATHVHRRGNFEDLGERVEARIPDRLLPRDSVRRVSNKGRATRLDLAKSMFHPSHPLTARVAVNRTWAHFFGQGLVATTDDFGWRSSYPTHPKLLDWLAAEFIASGWDVKHLQRLIVSSATYQQSSFLSERERLLDPSNRLLARGPRFRLEAEQIRDVALAASGLLTHRVGGPSVYPPQDPSIGQFRDETAGAWTESVGPDRYRRGLYTFWQRMSPYPSFVMLDAPNRERCQLARARTNTPLQSLVTLNDPAFVEIQRTLAIRIQREALAEKDRVAFAYQAILGRLPRESESELAHEFLNQSESSDKWFSLVQVLLNLDEAMTLE